MIRIRIHEIHIEEHLQLVGNIGLVRMDFSIGTAIRIIVHQGIGHIEDPADSRARHSVVRIGRVIEERNIRQRIYGLHPEAGGCVVIVVPVRCAYGEPQCLISHVSPFLKKPRRYHMGRIFIREGVVTEIAHVLERTYIPLQAFPGSPYRSAERKRRDGIQEEHCGKDTLLLVQRIAVFHYVMDLHHKLRIGSQPLFYLAAVEVFLCKVYVIGHTLGEFLRSVGGKVLGCIVGDAKVCYDLIFIHRDILPVQGLFYLFPGPSLGRVPD